MTLALFLCGDLDGQVLDVENLPSRYRTLRPPSVGARTTDVEPHEVAYDRRRLKLFSREINLYTAADSVPIEVEMGVVEHLLTPLARSLLL